MVGSLYTLGGAVARAATALAVSVAPSSNGKLAQSLRARRGLLDRIRARAAEVRDPSRPLIWLHAPSVGEGLQARPVAHALRLAHPDWQFAYTYFSPSAERFAESVGADVTDYLPFDTVRDADAMLDALKPTALVFVKLDVWPVLVERAVARRIPVGLLSATLSPASGRLGFFSRLALNDAYASLATVGAIDAANGERLLQLGVRANVVRVTGDTRFDQVWARAESVDRTSPLLSLLTSARPTLVAGSTWPADDAVLFDAWLAVRRAVPTARLIIAPHEPTAAHIEPLETWARKHKLRALRLSVLEERSSSTDAEADMIILDRVGILGEVYAVASAAFVGGGFHSAGLHSVIEPAAFGVPVAFGPRHQMSREAGLLLKAGGAAAVRTSRALAEVLTQWLADRNKREREGQRARDVVRIELGATARSVALVEDLIGHTSTFVEP